MHRPSRTHLVPPREVVPPPTERGRRLRPHGAIVVAVVVFALLGAACSSGNDTPGVASLNQDDAATSGDNQATDKDPQEAALEWAECMRKHGVDVPDPKLDDRGLVMIEPPNNDPTEATYQEASEACRDLLAPPRDLQDISPEDRARMADAALDYAECMREHGFDVPDPGPDGSIAIPVGEDGFDVEDPEFQAAEEDCRHFIEEALGARGGDAR